MIVFPAIRYRGCETLLLFRKNSLYFLIDQLQLTIQIFLLRLQRLDLFLGVSVYRTNCPPVASFIYKRLIFLCNSLLDCFYAFARGLGFIQKLLGGIGLINSYWLLLFHRVSFLEIPFVF